MQTLSSWALKNSSRSATGSHRHLAGSLMFSERGQSLVLDTGNIKLFRNSPLQCQEFTKSVQDYSRKLSRPTLRRPSIMAHIQHTTIISGSQGPWRKLGHEWPILRGHFLMPFASHLWFLPNSTVICLRSVRPYESQHFFFSLHLTYGYLFSGYVPPPWFIVFSKAIPRALYCWVC